MKREKGKPLPLGVSVGKDCINFAVQVPEGKACKLLLYKKGETEPSATYEMEEETAVGSIRFLALSDFAYSEYEYNYLIDKKVFIDPYARKLAGTEDFARKWNTQAHEVRARIYLDSYDWEGEVPPCIPPNEVIAYSLHVRGFTKHSSSKVTHKGTFRGVIEKIPYLLDLGVNQIHLMPVYEFEQKGNYVNYWGYGPGFYFAPKKAYASSGDPVTEMKDMVKKCHEAGIEVILEMPFEGDTPRILMEECLRYYMLEYHVDGFILNPDITPTDGNYADPLLSRMKIFHHQTGFQNVMRRFLKGDEGMIGDVIYWLRRPAGAEGMYNYIANHNGFTLNDLVSYDAKHNEGNGENNQDGPDYNYSWNCGAEGPSRKKAVMALREGQMRNALMLVFFAQGIPCILAGDEFGNTQKGNNNVYCQDNPVGWLDWSRLEKNKTFYEFVKSLITLRRSHPVLHQKHELKGMDQISCGVPDVSYHGQYAWQTPLEISSRQLGVYYCGITVEDADCFVAYNMHWVEHSFALPALSKNKKWYLAAESKKGILEKPELLENQRETVLKERTIALFISK